MRTIIVGAGASAPYELPVAWQLMAESAELIAHLRQRYKKGEDQHYQVSEIYLANNNDRHKAVIRAAGSIERLLQIAAIFKDHLVAQNLDDFVRDHPSMTDVVSTLILVSLFNAMYRPIDSIWQLRSHLRKGEIPPEKDWMRSLVGIMRPLATPADKIAVISFNYDGLLERSMRMYWNGAERKYWPLEECAEFVYPHGKISDFPTLVNDSFTYVGQQSKNIRVGENKDQAARERARVIIASSSKIYMVGFSLSASNQELLGLGQDKMKSGFFVQNFQSKDKRLSRILDDAGVPPNCRDDSDMDSLIRHGFFEQ